MTQCEGPLDVQSSSYYCKGDDAGAHCCSGWPPLTRNGARVPQHLGVGSPQVVTSKLLEGARWCWWGAEVRAKLNTCLYWKSIMLASTPSTVLPYYLIRDSSLWKHGPRWLIWHLTQSTTKEFCHGPMLYAWLTSAVLPCPLQSCCGPCVTNCPNK